MKRAFVITVEVDSNVDDTTIAEDIFDSVADSGYDVVTVNPHGGDAPTVSVEGLTPPTDLGGLL